MILRVFHGVPASGGEDALIEGIKANAVSTLERLPELTGFQLGIERADGGEIVIVTTWTDFAAILASGDAQVNAARSIADAPTFFVASHADHYEVVVGEEHGGPIARAELRVTTATLKPRFEATYFEGSRRLAPELASSHGLLFHLIGRRAVAEYIEICAVTLWDRGASEAAAQSMHAEVAELASCYAAPPNTRLYEPVVR